MRHLHAPGRARVAVIGGGIAGLAAAVRLHAANVQVTLFERALRIGGNVRTHRVEIDGVQRVVDLGVSDFDASSYQRVAAAAAALGVRTGAMEPSTGFATADGRRAFVLGRAAAAVAAPPPALLAAWQRFRREATEVLTDPALADWTVDRYLMARGYPRILAEDLLYPRISALWFSHEGHPGELPLLALQQFCQLQEGVRPGQPPAPRRRFFRDGARSLVEALAGCLPDVRLGQTPRVILGGRPVIITDNAPPEVLDAVVFAVHAEDVPVSVAGALPEPIRRVLGCFSYTSATAWLHRDRALMPPDTRAWGSFNARIRPAEALRVGRPYTVTMSVDRHQGRLPGDLLVTLNPDRAPDPRRLVRAADGSPITARFRHNVADLAARRGQAALPSVQGLHGAWFCGGYAHGVGLMEDCWVSAERAVDHLLRTLRWRRGEASPWGGYSPEHGVS